jgi:hypothetical protein
MVEKLGSMIKNCSLKIKFLKTHPKKLTDQKYSLDNFANNQYWFYSILCLI